MSPESPVTDTTPVRPMRVGVGGPVGSGKSSLIAELCRELANQVELAVVTNDIYTTADAEFLRRTGVIDGDRFCGSPETAFAATPSPA